MCQNFLISTCYIVFCSIKNTTMKVTAMSLHVCFHSYSYYIFMYMSSRQIMSSHIILFSDKKCYAFLCHVILYYVIRYYVLLCYVILYWSTSCYIILFSCCFMLCLTKSNQITLGHNVFYHI